MGILSISISGTGTFQISLIVSLLLVYATFRATLRTKLQQIGPLWRWSLIFPEHSCFTMSAPVEDEHTDAVQDSMPVGRLSNWIGHQINWGR